MRNKQLRQYDVGLAVIVHKQHFDKAFIPRDKQNKAPNSDN